MLAGTLVCFFGVGCRRLVLGSFTTFDWLVTSLALLSVRSKLLAWQKVLFRNSDSLQLSSPLLVETDIPAADWHILLTVFLDFG